MSHFQSLSAYRRSQPVRVTPPLHREIHENDLILGAKQFITSRFLSDQEKTGVNTVVFTRILPKSRRKYTAINQLGFNSLHPKQQDTHKKWVPCFFEEFLGKGLTKMKTATSYLLILLITALTENENPLGLLIKSKSIIGYFRL